MKPDGTILPLIDRVRLRALIVGGAGLVAAVAVGFGLYDAKTFCRAYLFTYFWLMGITLGCLALLMLHRQLGGAWGFLVRRPLEAAAMTLPLMAVLFVPIFLNFEEVYEWARPGFWEHSAEPKTGHPQEERAVKEVDLPKSKGGSAIRVRSEQPEPGSAGSSGLARDPLNVENEEYFGFKKWWLTPAHFTIRFAIYFLIWIVLAAVLYVGSRRQDETRSWGVAYGLQSLSAPGIVLYFLTTSLAVVDWGMTLEPHWYSSLYGAMIIVGQGGAAISVMILVTRWLIAGRGETPGLDTPDTYNDLGNLLLAFTMLWGYLSFSQFLIIYSGNLVEEIPWYSRRLENGWEHIGQYLMAFHFFVPFLILLSRPIKRNIRWLWVAAALMLFSRLVDNFWLITPSFGEWEPGQPPPPVRVTLVDILMPIGLGGIWLAAFLTLLRRRDLMVVTDPELEPALIQAAGH